ncbi:MAG TPA: 3-methyl-2-oxobutanoate dehydrogenase subunit VorB [Syntrophales bacterium]|nr:3-methyl-2-oxobutanoate dehydrogenase subunit VorB [Syntrophales bacterium]HRV42829.1 3-methyl-2-oxobutanoate dehydrogenase subunit VorB [Syntrophales bacterium]
MNRVLMQGNRVIGEAAIRAGCRFYAGYPITPQNELTEYMAEHMRKVKGGVFIQAESELAAINMVLGASAAGARAMTSSSSPGISLKQEGISSLAADELPAVIVNIMRGGPGLGNILPSQGDYFQATRGGGHGDYRTIVLAPASVQELADLTMDAFDLADRYRNPVLLLADGMMGQMMEPVEFRTPSPRQYREEYILRGKGTGKSRFIRALILDAIRMEEHNWKLYRKYQVIAEEEVRFETFWTDDAEILIVAYGTAARIAKGAIKRSREMGIAVGLIRPITLWPFPGEVIRRFAEEVGSFLVFEMNTGQMLEDVKLALEGRARVDFYGRPGGVIPTPAELAKVIAYQVKR